MVSTHHLKRAFISIIATLSLLFMQLAAAAYVCTEVTGSARLASAAMTMDAAPCSTDTQSGCSHSDATRAARCVAQAYTSNEITPELQIPKLLVIAQNAWIMAFPLAPDGVASWQPSPHPSPGLTRAISPSISIRNCCYRV